MSCQTLTRSAILPASPPGWPSTASWDTTFVPGTTPDLLEAAKEAEVDVLVGGFTSTSPGVIEGKEVGVTGTYPTTRFVVGVPPDRPTFDDPSGRKIAVERIDTTAAMLKEEGAVPVPVEVLSTAEMPIAAYEWQLPVVC
jgi:hypothetical protein